MTSLKGQNLISMTIQGEAFDFVARFLFWILKCNQNDDNLEFLKPNLAKY
jgi:hypothetical protein